MHDVAVGDDILLALEAKLPRVAGAGLAVERDIVAVSDRLRADESLLEVGMDDAGRGRRLGAAMNGPGAGFLRPHREIGDEVEKLVAGADQPVETCFLQSQ